jgi:hypothetical protein
VARDRSARLTVRAWLVENLPRWLAVALRLRRLTPEGHYWPRHSVTVEPIDADTGGAFRAAWRQQDPSVDPREPLGGESSSTGTDHGWSNCTMTSGALAMAYQQPRGSVAPWGGDLRHAQSDLSGGTDLYDLRDAWEVYGETLTIRSGAGWSALDAAHDEGRAVVIQGSGNVPGSESFDGGHACVIAPETHADGRWLFGDPLATGWQWVSVSSIRSWAEHWQSSIAFATGEKPPPPPPPPPSAPACPPETPRGPELERADDLGRLSALDEEVGRWLEYLGPIGPVASSAWDGATWAGTGTLDELLAGCDEPVAVWGRGPAPDPVAAADHARRTAALWDGEAWRSLVWH